MKRTFINFEPVHSSVKSRDQRISVFIDTLPDNNAPYTFRTVYSLRFNMTALGKTVRFCTMEKSVFEKVGDKSNTVSNSYYHERLEGKDASKLLKALRAERAKPFRVRDYHNAYQSECDCIDANFTRNSNQDFTLDLLGNAPKELFVSEAMLMSPVYSD